MIGLPVRHFVEHNSMHTTIVHHIMSTHFMVLLYNLCCHCCCPHGRHRFYCSSSCLVVCVTHNTLKKCNVVFTFSYPAACVQCPTRLDFNQLPGSHTKFISAFLSLHYGSVEHFAFFPSVFLLFCFFLGCLYFWCLCNISR